MIVVVLVDAFIISFIINYHIIIVNTILLFLLTFIFMVWYNKIFLFCICFSILHKNFFCLFFVCFVCMRQNNTKNHYSTLAYIYIIFNISQSITRFYKKIQKCDFIINGYNTRLYSISLETLVNTRFLH